MRKILLLAGIPFSLIICVLLIYRVNVGYYWSDPVYKERIWLHRTNTPAKLLQFAAEYDGFECDILLRHDSIADITHDEPVSHGIGPEAYFKLMQGNNRKIWFDFKNLTPVNASRVSCLFDSLCEKYDVDKRRLIVEGSDPGALGTMHENGYYTSYYVPVFKEKGRKEDEIRDFYQEVNRIAGSGGVDAVSFYVRQYPSVNRYVTASVDLLTWSHHDTKEFFSLTERGRTILKDNRVKVILVKDKGDHHK